jgi:UDP:flavonoid glycosyltransferase YjiC (YdhE family)
MRILSEHWIAYPRLIAGELSWLERLKLKMLGRPRVRYLDTVLPAPVAAESLPELRDFILVVPGGGTAHPGARDAPGIISAAAAGLAQQGLRTVLVGTANSPDNSILRTTLPLLPQAQLVGLMRRARVVVSNGGDTLLQALACGCACVAVPIAHDQAARIARCRELRLINDAPLESAAIIAAVMRLHTDDALRAGLVARARAAGVTDTMPQVLEWIAALSIEAHP